MSLHSRTAMPNRITDTMEKPQLDQRTYRVIQLPNQLEALLIHDPETDKASAAMDVGVGSLSDSDELPGIAHAVEHMLFMGTKKYPGENDYNQYLQKYGGHSNAYTASTDTNYYFELSATSTANSQTSSLSSKASQPVPKTQAPLYGALDRFAQFFIHPLFLEDTMDRELRAVDSENKKNLQSDLWRLEQLNRSLSSKKHPYNKFSTGSYKVLHDDPIAENIDIRQAFMDFHKRFYSANRMKLVVLGREELDELESWVTEFCSDIPNQDLPRLRWDNLEIYTEDEVRTQVFAKPVMDTRWLYLYFRYPDEEELWQSHPARYISHLLGHEGPGSILAYIKAKGWADGLHSGEHGVCPGGVLFNVSIRLTEDGLKNYQEVLKTVFQYVSMLREQPPQEWVVQEMQKLSEIEFRFRQRIPASRTTSSLARTMQKPLPREKLLSAQTVISKFDGKAIQRGLDHITPDTFRYHLVAQEFPAGWDQKEKWYGTEYKYEKIPEELMKTLRNAYNSTKSDRPAELHMPGKNQFIPSRLDVEKKEVSTPATTPKLIRNDGRVRTWWKKDDQFWAPKANLNIVLRSAMVNVSALTTTMAKLWKELVEDALVEYSYDADLAGLEYSLFTHQLGIDVAISGYNDKMHVLLEKVLTTVRNLEIKDDRFAIIKERLLKDLKNYEFQQPYQQISYYSHWLISERSFTNPELLEELPMISADDLRQFVPQMLSQLHVEVLAHGNLHREDALRMTDIVESVLKTRTLPASQWPQRRSLLIPPGGNFVYKRPLQDPQNVNHCINYALFTTLNSDRVSRAKTLLLAQMVEEPVFDTLRTKEQLGYVVSSAYFTMAAVSGWRILIQSERTPDYLEKRIDKFIVDFGEKLKEMSEEDFEAFKVALINSRLEKLKNLNSETSRFWHHVTTEKFDFDLVHRDVEHIAPLTKAQLIEFFNTYIHPSAEKRAKASVHLIAATRPEDLAGKTDPAEKVEKLAEALDQLLVQLSIESDRSALKKRLEAVSSELGVSSVSDALSSHLGSDVGKPQKEVDEIMAQVTPVLQQALPALGVAAATGSNDTSALEASLPKGREPVLIENVRAFKAGLALSEGAVPVKDLAEFEDIEPKL